MSYMIALSFPFCVNSRQGGNSGKGVGGGIVVMLGFCFLIGTPGWVSCHAYGNRRQRQISSETFFFVSLPSLLLLKFLISLLKPGGSFLLEVTGIRCFQSDA